MKTTLETDARVKKTVVGLKESILAYMIILLLVKIQVDIIMSQPFHTINRFVQVAIIMVYWAVVTLLFRFSTNWQIRRSYDVPMQRLSAAAKKVAEGDFSVYAEPLNTPDHYDYIDVMFLDFNAMVKELGSIETLKNDFVANVSHEIKTPLSVIKNYTMALRNENLSENTRNEYIETIVKATDNLSSLAGNILQLNKLENQEIETVPEVYDLCRQLCDCALNFDSLWEEKKIDFSADIEDKAIIRAHEHMLEIVWNNLLSNALKYTEPGGKINLVQTSDADTITVSISDTGCGMDNETMKHVFEKFYQADTSRSCEGNGLGLALALRVVEKLGGTLTVKSAVGHGSTFTVVIPIRD